MKSSLLNRYIYPLKELHYFFTYPIINFLKHPQKSSTLLPSKGTIVIVECWFQSNEYHLLWQNYLEKKGFRTHLLTFNDMNESFASTAKKLNFQIESLGIKNFSLVGISTGAIVCLEYLTQFEKWKSIKKFISVGGPLRGTPAAWLISFTKKGRDMTPDSQLIHNLSQRYIPKNKMVTLSASHDELIPLKNSVLEGVPSYIIHVYGHNFFHLDHKNTYDLIAELSE
jgi:pimeloyl-ACP methyl ester carboxylesterase